MKRQYYSLVLITLVTLFSLGKSASAQICSADFNATIDGATVAFDGMATGVAPSYFWDFGDGSNAFIENPEHTYTSNGLYLVCFYVYAADSCFASSCDSVYITGAAGGDCNAFYTYDISGETVIFNNLSSPADVASVWSFGDGGVSFDDEPTHTFEPGTYEVCLTVYGADSCTDDYCQTITIFEGGDSLSCSAYFTFSAFGGSVDFENLSYTDGFDASYFWDFGDGTESTLENPSHVYDDGTYTVCLTLFTADSCSSSYCGTLFIGGGIDSGACTADFDVDITGTLAEFDNNSSTDVGIITGNYWTFGDGSTSGATNPNHEYAADGAYEVCLTIYTSDSCSSTYCETVFIGGGIDSSFCNADFDTDIAGAFAEFTNNSTGGFADIITYNWDFGDGSTSTTENPNHTYAFPGVYNVCLTIFTDDSCVSTYCDMISIIGIDDSTECAAAFNYDFGITPWGIFTTNDSYDGGATASYFWDFGDGTTSTDFEPAHEYTAGGAYIICLTITTAFCTDTQCDTVTIAPTAIEEEIIINQFQVYPNPAKNNITIQIDNGYSNDVTIFISDLNGRNVQDVFAGTLNPGIQTFNADIQSLPAGIYMLQVSSEKGVEIQKIVKE